MFPIEFKYMMYKIYRVGIDKFSKAYNDCQGVVLHTPTLMIR
jgi:hypothetical protein